MSIRNPYNPEVNSAKGHKLGLLTDGDSFPAESLQDVLNMELTPNGDKRRLPYILDYNPKQELRDNYGITEYEIVSHYKKTFYNNATLSKTCTILVINTYSSSTHSVANFVKTRIFIKGYYDAGAGYDNSPLGNPTRAKGYLRPIEFPEVYAYGFLRATDPDNFSDGDTITIEDITGSTMVIYTMRNVIAGANDVLIGTDAYDSFGNIKAAINHEAGEGTKYGAGTVEHPDVSANRNLETGGSYLSLIAKVIGSNGNTIDTLSSNANIVWDAATLENGYGIPFTDGDEIEIGSKTYRMKDTMSAPYDVKIVQNSLLTTLMYLVDAIVCNTEMVGVAYFTGTEVNPDVIPYINYTTGVITLLAQLLGTAGNTVPTTDTSASVEFDDATLLNGEGGGTGDAEFTDDLIELTEIVEEDEIGNEEYSSSGWTAYEDYNYRVANADFKSGDGIKTHNYYKGWFIHSAINLWGFCNGSTYDVTGGYHYFMIDFQAGSQEVLGLSRFAVGFEALSIFTSGIDANTLRKYSFSEFPNGLKIYPQGERILQIQFIKDRTNVNIVVNGAIKYSVSVPGGITNYEFIKSYTYSGEPAEYQIDLWRYRYDPYAATVDYHIYFIKNGVVKADFVKAGVLWDYTGNIWNEDEQLTDGNLTITLKEINRTVLGLGGLIDAYEFLHWYGDFSISIQTANKWDGFYFDYDCPKILTKKNYYLIESGFTAPWHGHATKELGIWFMLDSVYDAGGSKAAFYSYVIQIDGFQNLFIFNAVSKEGKYQVGIKLYLEPFFNRRITAFIQSYFQEAAVKFSPNLNRDNEIPDTFLLDENAPGKIEFEKAGFTYDPVLREYFVSGISSTKTHAQLTAWATLITLQMLLNQYYWKEQSMKCNGGTELGDGNTLVYGIADDIIVKDESSVTGKLAIATSNKQNSVINTHSVFSSERYYQFVNEEIIDVVAITGYQFLIFTRNLCKWYEILDYLVGEPTEKGTYQDFGAMSKEGIIRIAFKESASMGTASWEFGAMQFGGIMFANEVSIFLFEQNKPVDMLFDEKSDFSLLREFYQSLDKTNMKSGYYPDLKQVWYYIDGYIFVYCMNYKNWTIYYLPDVPVNFSRDEYGRITLTDGQKIFRMSDESEEYYLDKENIIDAYASGILTGSVNFANNDTITIGAVTYTVKTVIAVANDILKGADLNETLTNLKKAINYEDPGTNEGVIYGTGTVLHPTVTAISVVDDILSVRAKTIGSVGNSIVTSLTFVSALDIYWGWTTLVDGTDSEQTGIEMYFKKIINHGTKLTTKIPDMFFMSFEAENTDNTGVLDDALFTLEVIGYTEKGSKEIYNRTFSTVKNGLQAIVKEILYRIRKRCNYYTLELSMSTSEAENVKRLRIYDLSSKALLTGHKLTKA